MAIDSFAGTAFINKTLVMIFLYFFVPGDVLLKPIIQEAGKDISHWFDKKTRDVSHFSIYH